MRVFIFDEQKDLVFNPSKIEHLARSVADLEGKSYDEVSIYLVDKKEITLMHADFFNDPTPTDCISFPQCETSSDGPYRLMGDVFVCTALAKDYVEEHGGNPYEEAALYIVHGLLHLMGYKDKTPEDQTRMRWAETRHMEHLKNQGILPLSLSFDAN